MKSFGADTVKEKILREILHLPGVEERSVVGGTALWFDNTFAVHIERRTPTMHIKLSAASRRRALREENISRCNMFAKKDWVSVSLRSERDIRSALRWAFVAYQEIKKL